MSINPPRMEESEREKHVSTDSKPSCAVGDSQTCKPVIFLGNLRPKTMFRGNICNICYCIPVEPILTECTHLFCWNCIYIWSQAVGSGKLCPVCRCSLDVNKSKIADLANLDNQPSQDSKIDENLSTKIKVVKPGGRTNTIRFGSTYLYAAGSESISCRFLLILYGVFFTMMAVSLRPWFGDITEQDAIEY